MNQAQLRHSLSKGMLRRPLRWWQHRSIQKQDVMLASYPRSGNSWVRFLLYECISGETADFLSINDPYSPLADFPKFHKAPVLTAVRGRIIKTHEGFCSKYGRAIFLVRDPRAVMVSEFHYLRGRGLYNKQLNDFVVDFVAGKVNRYGAWHSHTASWLDAPITNLLIIRYEDLKTNSCDVLSQMIDFLGLDLDLTKVEKIVTHNNVRAMQQVEKKHNLSTFHFVNEEASYVRQAKTHGWRDELTLEQVILLEEKMGATMNRLGYDSLMSL